MKRIALCIAIGLGAGVALPAIAHQNERVKLAASDGAAGDNFGFSIAMHVDTVVVGAPRADSPGTDSGAAYVFVGSGMSWVEQAKLIPSEALIGDNYGLAVAIHGDVIVVASPHHPDNGADSGILFIWERSGTTWTEVVKILASDGQAGDLFGSSVVISGTTVIAGAPGGDKAYVITKTGATWSESAILTGIDTVSGDLFGADAAIDGDRAIIGAPLHDEVGTDSGVAYVFERIGTTWTQDTKLTSSDSAPGDEFGSGVAIQGDQIFIGAPRADITSLIDAGAAYEFQRSTVWSEVRKYMHQIPGAGDQFGATVDIAGFKLLAGVRFDDQAAGNSGSTFEFYCDPASTACFQILVASDAGTDDELGISAAGTTCWVSVGAHLDDDNGVDAGAFYLYLLPRKYSFCTAKTNSCGTTPVISRIAGSVATPSSTSGYFITGSNAKTAKFGLLIYTNQGRTNPVPFQGGFLCLATPVNRGPAVQALGGTPGQCDAMFQLEMNKFAAGLGGGNPQAYLSVPGTAVGCQWWGRDTLANGSYLSDAMEYFVCP